LLQSTKKVIELTESDSNLFILAIDTSSQVTSVALLDGPNLIAESKSKDLPAISRQLSGNSSSDRGDQLPSGFTKKRNKGRNRSSRVFPPGASVLLAPMIKELLTTQKVGLDQISIVALAFGPGLFTGLRVGVVTAKSLAYSTGAKLIGVNTLEVIAAQTACEMSLPQESEIQVVLNAQRQQLFSANYRTGESWKVVESQPNRILDRETWLESVESGLVTGAGLRPIEGQLKEKSGLQLSPSNCWDCSAGAVGKLAFQKSLEDRFDDLWTLQPLYFRPSSAEEVRQKKLDAEGKVS
jgi:tRNA threonylcarbamoyladenosine biosynthesis protein TsaB